VTADRIRAQRRLFAVPGVWTPVAAARLLQSPVVMRSIHLLAGALLLAASCEGPTGPSGPAGDSGGDGDDGEPGTPGDPGSDGDTPLAPWLTSSGLAVEITSASIDGDTVSLVYRITDGNDVPVDRTGLLTDGTVTASFALAWLDEAEGDPLQYTSYITRIATKPGTDITATQATTESDSMGTTEVVDRADGTYRYTFNATITPVANRTHTVGIAAGRVIGDETFRADATFNFMPDGGAVSTTRQVVADSNCNSCHGDLEGHGGRYSKTAMCMMCHTPQSTDPDTGNTLNFPVMLHKIHRGAELPSFDDGGIPYQIIGFGGSVHDFSTVEFPQLIQRCDSCHGGAAQGNYWMNRPSATNCRSCHDNLVFAPQTPESWQIQHLGNVPETAACATCHTGSGTTISVADVHMNPAFDPESPEVAIDVRGVTNSGPGQQPVIEFRVTVDGAPRDILSSPLNNLAAVVAGPNTDFARYLSYSIQPTPGTNPGTITAVDAADGVFTFQPAAALALPADAGGSWTVAMTGYLNGATSEERFTAVADLLPFAVTDAVATSRRTVVDTANCNKCHYDVNGHGGSRKGAQFCTLCHNPNNANDERAPRLEGQEVFVETVDFKVMIHKIHAGEHLENGYVLGGFPAPTTADPDGTPTDFSEVRFPNQLNNCTACHDGNSFTLPLAAGVLPSRYEERNCVEAPGADGNDLCGAAGTPDPSLWQVTPVMVAPQTAVCTSCHDSLSVLIHAEVNTSNGQEACSTCHDTGSVEDVASVHGF